MTHTILVPLDGSDFAENALSTAFAVAKRWPARVHLVSIEPPMPPIRDLPIEIEMQGWAQKYLDDVQGRIRDRTGMDVETTAGEGPIRETIEAVAQELDADLIVLSTHGRGPLSRAWLGSIADALARSSEIPLLLVRPRDGGAPDLGADFAVSRLLVPLDGSRLAESALDPAQELGRCWGSELSLLRVVRYPNEALSPYLPDTVRMVEEAVRQGTAAAEAYMVDVAGRLQAEGVEAETHVAVANSVARGILHHAEESGADLIALASHGHGGFRRAMLGSIADKVVRGAEHPVLVVRAPEG